MIKKFREYAIFWLKINWRNVYSVVDSFLEEQHLPYKYYDVLDKELEKIKKTIDK